MNYTKDEINDLLDQLKPSTKEESAYTSSHMSASTMSTFCANPGGEDLFTVGCEDARY